MTLSNYERLVKLADEVFAVRDDPNQLDVNEQVLEKLKKIHPSTISQYDEGNGPVAWVLLIPTTQNLMQKFLDQKISERELFNLTKTGIAYDSIYLCSALVLEEFRRKGIVKRLTLEAIKNIRQMNPVQSLFVWAFSPEGEAAADHIALLAGLPLYKREH